MLKIQDKIVYRMTMHCRERYYQRIANLEWKGQSLIDKKIWEDWEATPENKSWQNNMRMVDYLKGRYGHCKIKIRQSKNLMFIASRDENISNLYYIVTCFKPSEFNSFQI
tara:strand:- start:1512 stop:1841 length:330 start_codon:yes stop_codon:yes gene_type:complete